MGWSGVGCGAGDEDVRPGQIYQSWKLQWEVLSQILRSWHPFGCVLAGAGDSRGVARALLTRLRDKYRPLRSMLLAITLALRLQSGPPRPKHKGLAQPSRRLGHSVPQMLGREGDRVARTQPHLRRHVTATTIALLGAATAPSRRCSTSSTADCLWPLLKCRPFFGE